MPLKKKKGMVPHTDLTRSEQLEWPKAIFVLDRHFFLFFLFMGFNLFISRKLHCIFYFLNCNTFFSGLTFKKVNCIKLSSFYRLIFATDTPDKLDVLRVECDSLGMYATKVSHFQKANNICLCSFLESHQCHGLQPEIWQEFTLPLLWSKFEINKCATHKRPCSTMVKYSDKKGNG